MRDNFTLQTAITPPSDLRPGTGTGSDARSSQTPSFEATLQSAIQGVEQLQMDADKQASLQAAGAGNLHETSIALEKADLSMRVLVKARSKIMEAYHETMRMSI